MNTASEKYQFVPIFENFIHLLGLTSTMTMYPSLLAFLLFQNRVFKCRNSFSCGVNFCIKLICNVNHRNTFHINIFTYIKSEQYNIFIVYIRIRRISNNICSLISQDCQLMVQQYIQYFDLTSYPT